MGNVCGLEIIKSSADQSARLRREFFDTSTGVLMRTAAQIVAALKRGNKLLIFGNGGSAADAQHIAAELVNRFVINRSGLPAIALTTDTSALTSIGNDMGFEFLFSRQIEALGKKEDLAVGISTSGNSPNVIHGLSLARSLGIITVALTGKDGGQVGKLADYHLNVPSRSTARVQEIHIMIGHILCDLIERHMYN